MPLIRAIFSALLILMSLNAAISGSLLPINHSQQKHKIHNRLQLEIFGRELPI